MYLRATENEPLEKMRLQRGTEKSLTSKYFEEAEETGLRVEGVRGDLVRTREASLP